MKLEPGTLSTSCVFFHNANVRKVMLLEQAAHSLLSRDLGKLARRPYPTNVFGSQSALDWWHVSTMANISAKMSTAAATDMNGALES